MSELHRDQYLLFLLITITSFNSIGIYFMPSIAEMSKTHSKILIQFSCFTQFCSDLSHVVYSQENNHEFLLKFAISLLQCVIVKLENGNKSFVCPFLLEYFFLFLRRMNQFGFCLIFGTGKFSRSLISTCNEILISSIVPYYHYHTTLL